MAKRFKTFITESHNYKLGDKVVYGGETHVVRKLGADEKIGIRKARSNMFGGNMMKMVHHKEVAAYVPPAKPDKTSSDYGTCQVCGKLHKVTKGVMAHHGYMRPGDGQQTNSCYGARHKPFEQSRDRLASHIENIHNSIKHNKNMEHELATTEQPFSKMIKRSFAQPPELYEFKPGTPAYAYEKKRQIDHHHGQVKLLTDYAGYQQNRHDKWKPKK